MDKLEAAQQFANLMAVALQELSQANDQQLSLLKTSKDFQLVYATVQQTINGTKKQNVSALLHTIQCLLDDMRHHSDQVIRLSYAMSLCLCMDQLICYAEPTAPLQIWEGGRIYLHSLVPVKSDRQPVSITALNQNQKETGICIAPKFPVSSALMEQSGGIVPRGLASRNALHGMNSSLLNVNYYPYQDGFPTVHHIILAERPVRHPTNCLPTETRIVFSPLTDRPDLLKESEIRTQIINDIRCQVKAVERLTDPSHIEERFKETWLAACEYEADIFFAPEMLATDSMVCIEHDGSVFLKPLLKTAAKQGQTPPRLTIMPTHWKDGFNRLLAFDETGRYLGTQFKQFPFINQKEGYAEALRPAPNADILMIHMKNQQRIAVAICAEFLSLPEYINDILCRQLGATLLLIPSYSPGERDFMDKLPTLKPYGTSVVWGNCCGAAYHGKEPEAKRIIGACSYAGTDQIFRFGSVSQCNFHCDSCKTCFYVISIPTQIMQEKPGPSLVPPVSHICR